MLFYQPIKKKPWLETLHVGLRPLRSGWDGTPTLNIEILIII